MSWSSQKNKEGISERLFFPQEIFLTFALSQCIVY